MASTQLEEKKVNFNPSRKEEGKKRLEALKMEETRPVKGIFQCYECPGSSAHICVKKFKDVPMFDQVMIDGQEYEIPLYVARHLNGIDKCAIELNGMIHSCSYPVHKYAMDKNGNTRIDVNKHVRRYGFQSMEFVA